MAIKAYTGVMGSGKTYEVVSEVILGGLRGGRRVVSNIAGLNYDAMVAQLIAEGVAEASIGLLVHVEHEEVLKAEFWRTDAEPDAFIEPGDLLALDEVWRFWDGFAAKTMPERVMNFFRMHRHFIHSVSGVACDVALISQDVADIGRRVRSVIEECYVMTKLTAVGSANRYRVDVHASGRSTKASLIRSIQRSYNPKYFELYQSHSQKQDGGASAREVNIDDRGNILRGALFRVVIPAGFLVALVAVWFVWRFFHREDIKPPPSSGGVEASKVELVPASVSTSRSESADWRVVGYYRRGGSVLFVLSDGDRMRVIEPPSFKITATSAETFLPSGEAVTTWGGRTVRGAVGMVDRTGGAK